MRQRHDGYIGILLATDMYKIRSTDYTHPLGQNILATYLSDRLHNFAAAVVDGERTEKDRIKRFIDWFVAQNPLIGLTLLAGNSQAIFEFAKELAGKGYDIVIGGPEVTAYGAEAIMKSRPFIRYGIEGAGEQVLYRLVAGNDITAIPNLTYRHNQEIHVNSRDVTIAKRLDWSGVRVDYSLIHDLRKKEGVSYLTNNDCCMSDRRCDFCGRQSLGNPEGSEISIRMQRAAKEIEQAMQFGMRFYYNTADSSGVNRGLFLREFAGAVQDFQPEFNHTFFNSLEINEQIIPYIKKINITPYLGLETAAEEHMQKPWMQTKRDYERSLSLLKGHDIQVRASFVFGLPGESRETMQENLEKIVWLIGEYPNITYVSLSPVEILAGSKYFHELMETPEGQQFCRENSPPFNITQLTELHMKTRCSISRSELLDIINQGCRELTRIRPNLDIGMKDVYPEEGPV